MVVGRSPFGGTSQNDTCKNILCLGIGTDHCKSIFLGADFMFQPVWTCMMTTLESSLLLDASRFAPGSPAVIGALLVSRETSG